MFVWSFQPHKNNPLRQSCQYSGIFQSYTDPTLLKGSSLPNLFAGKLSRVQARYNLPLISQVNGESRRIFSWGISVIQQFCQFALASFVTLLPIVNPIGNTPVFLAITESKTPQERHQIAQKVALYVFITLAIFLLLGGGILRFFGISLNVVRIAGGIVVFHAAWGMLNSDETMTTKEHQESRQKEDVAFFPMTMPLLAGPGAIAVTLGLSARAGEQTSLHLLFSLLATLAAIIALVILVYCCLRASDWLFELLGETGTRTLTRIFGFLILAVGVQLLLSGLAGWIKTLSLPPGAS